MPVVIFSGKCYLAGMDDDANSSKQKTILAAAKLLRRHGYHGVALRDVVAAADAPRGSLYFHFPKGKEEIAVAALKLAADVVRQDIAKAAKGAKSAEEFLIRICRGMGASLERSDFKEGCPIAPTALEMAGVSKPLTAVARGSYKAWEEEIAIGLQAFGFASKQSKLLATAALSLLEGALLLARAYQSLEPMQRAEEPIRLLVRGFGNS